MANALKSLRYAIWGSGGKVRPEDTGEALRDIHGALKTITPVRAVRLQGFVWAPPFFIQNDTAPAAVLLGDSKLAQQPTSAAVGSVPFTFLNQQVRIDSITGLTVGVAYDLCFVVIG